MIHYIKGNLLESSAQALVNTVNTVGVMGKGLALQFKEQYPVNYSIYKDACRAKRVQIGKMFITTEHTLEGDKIIVNFPTKTTWRKPSEYSYIESGLQDLCREIKERNIQSIAIPPLGSHNGGLDWLKVKGMIEGALLGLDCDIYIYEPTAEIVERLKTERIKLTPARAMMLDVLCDCIAYGEFVSVFEAEKIVYFLQRFGADDEFRIQFIPYYYGPYSKGKVAHVLYALNGSYIKGMGGMQAKPFDELWMLPDTPSTIHEYLSREENMNYREIANRTKDFLRGFYSNFSIEMLATVDYILQHNDELENWKSLDGDRLYAAINSDLESWNNRKGRLFAHSKYLPKIVDHLSQLYK